MPLGDELEQRVIIALRIRLETRDDLDLAPPQAGGDLERREPHPGGVRGAQRVRDLRLRQPEQPHDLAPVMVAPAIAAWNASVATASSHIGCSSLGGPGSTTTVGSRATLGGGTTRPGAVPPGASTVAPDGITACLRLAARSASRSASGQRSSAGFRISPIRASSALVEHHLAPAEAPDDLRRQIVRRGPEAAAGDDHRDPGRRHLLERRKQILGTVTDHLDHRHVDSEVQQPLGQPRAVAVADDPGQDLGARDEDAGPDGGPPGEDRRVAHCPQVGGVASGEAPCGVIFSPIAELPVTGVSLAVDRRGDVGVPERDQQFRERSAMESSGRRCR